ncbi:beta strand repeat-containing protein [Celeribacter marinus]|uniref:Outer membrane autotransporter n=1 Tax=Celeribacter marinus TaxID=1397108 RepID=A0A0N7HIC1_9RHOB|nr:hypothetical protein [Celeribacter marinus]ALI54805.1 outer membrane autotransporter [Celeribacter marinus]SFJ98780.1 autotransporter-associated beta strand repeat-containing protein [Celeribacter marinus]
MHNFTTTGGAGSGGGAGLGGVFFVDQGATLTVINTDFKSNRVEGGQGGSDAALRFYDKSLSVTGSTVTLPSIVVLGDIELLTYNTTSGLCEFDTASASSDTLGLLQKDSTASFGAYGAVAKVDSISATNVRFETPVSIAADKVIGFTNSNITAVDDELSVSYAYADDGQGGYKLVEPAGLNSIVKGSKLVAGISGDRANQMSTVSVVEYYTAAEAATKEGQLGAPYTGLLQGKIKSITLEDNLSSESSLTTFDFLGAPTFDVAQFYTTDNNGIQTITMTNPTGTFREGMTVTWTEDGNEQTATIDTVSSDGRSFVLDNAALPADVFAFDAVENPMTGDNSVRISGAQSQFSVGQTIYVPSESGGAAFEATVASVSSDDIVTVTPVSSGTKLADFYNSAVGLAIKIPSAEVTGGGSTITIKYDTSKRSGETDGARDARIAAEFGSRTIDGAAFVEGTTADFASLDATSGTVTLSLSENAISGESVEYFKLYDPLSTGGSMNNIAAPAHTGGPDGGDGYSANGLSSFFNDGEGVDGTNGGPAGDPDNGVGFNGGDGGNGTDGQPVNAWLIYDMVAAAGGLKTATMDIGLASLDVAAAATPDPVIGAAVSAPDPVEVAKAATGMSKAQIDLGFAIADLTLATVNLSYWAAQLGQGLAGLGGAGGDAGEASGGGSGLGGALFVREGGNLVIQGDALFELNYVAGGTTTSEFGEAGMAAGTDLFMMKGANVRLQPGLGSEIRFEGDIADDSLATNDGFMNAAGDGADITIAGDGGLVIFNGENTYSGNTILEGASLTAEMGVGVNDSSLMRFNGAGSTTIAETGTLALATAGSFLLQEDYVRRAGMDPFETSWTGSGGFASSLSEGVKVNLGLLDEDTNRGQALKWGFDGFFVGGDATGAGMNGALTFGSELAVGAVEFTNSVDLNGFDGSGAGTIGRVAVDDTGAVGSSQATLSGDWTNGGLVVGDANPTSDFTGSLFMMGDNALSQLLLAGGTLSTYAGEDAAGTLFAANADIVVGSNSTLHTFADEVATTVNVAEDGIWALSGGLDASGSVVNSGTIGVIGDHEWLLEDGVSRGQVYAELQSVSALDYLADDFADWNGIAKVGGDVTNASTGSLLQFGALDVTGSVFNAGIWGIGANVNVGTDIANTGQALVIGDIESVGGSVANGGFWDQKADVTVTGNVVNEDSDVNAAEFSQNGTLTAGGYVENNAHWYIGTDSAINAATLIGSGEFCLEDGLVDANLECGGGTATTLDLALTGDSTFDGVFAGSGNLTKKDVGVLTLTAAQAFAGILTVEGGLIQNNATMNDALDIVVETAGAYTVGAADTVATITNRGTFTVDQDVRTTALLHNDAGGKLTLNADVATSAGNVQNDGEMVLSGDRTLTLGTTTAAGLTGAATGVIKIDAAQSLTVDQDADTTYSGSFARVGDDRSASFTKAGDGVLTLAGAVDLLTINITEGALAFNGDDLINHDANVNVALNASMVLTFGDQSINKLLGAGTVELGANDLFIRDGGSFDGSINGTGMVDVESGDFAVSGTLASPDSLFVVNDTSTTTVTSTGSLAANNLQVDGDLVLGGNGAMVTAADAQVTGVLRGSGMVDASTTVHGGGQLNPGASPGELTFANLTLASGSSTTMEIDTAGASAIAGTDYDRVNVSTGGTLTITDDAVLNLVENDASALGETTHIFDFDDFAIDGMFGTATTTGTNDVIMNLATGNVVGLGTTTLSELEALALTPNHAAIYDGLMVNDAGGVAQFYGGEFVEALTQTLAASGDTSAVFRKASPEAYASLGSAAEAAAVNAMPNWIAGFAGYEGQKHSFFNASNAHFDTAEVMAENTAFGVDVTTSSTGFGQTMQGATVLFSLGTVSSSVNSDLMTGSGSGNHFGATVLGEIAGSNGAFWTMGVSHTSVTLDGTRLANGGTVDFDNVRSSATQMSFGLEYQHATALTNLGLRAGAVFGTSSSDAFMETTGGSNTLDVMAVDKASSSYARLELGTKLGVHVGNKTQLSGALDLSAPFGGDNMVDGSYDNGQGAFSVGSVGLNRANMSARVGVTHAITDAGTVSFDLGADNAWGDDADVTASLEARFSF